jgi:hypothetical protein
METILDFRWQKPAKVVVRKRSSAANVHEWDLGWVMISVPDIMTEYFAAHMAPHNLMVPGDSLGPWSLTPAKKWAYIMKARQFVLANDQRFIPNPEEKPHPPHQDTKANPMVSVSMAEGDAPSSVLVSFQPTCDLGDGGGTIRIGSVQLLLPHDVSDSLFSALLMMSQPEDSLKPPDDWQPEQYRWWIENAIHRYWKSCGDQYVFTFTS